MTVVGAGIAASRMIGKSGRPDSERSRSFGNTSVVLAVRDDQHPQYDLEDAAQSLPASSRSWLFPLYPGEGRGILPPSYGKMQMDGLLEVGVDHGLRWCSRSTFSAPEIIGTV